MKIKYMISFCLIVVFLMSMAGVSAGEDINQTSGNDFLSADLSDDGIGMSNNQEILSANRGWYVNASTSDGGNGSETNPYNNFKSVLDNESLQDGDTVYFAGGQRYAGDGINVNLEIKRNLNLVTYGMGDAVFDGERNSGIFKVSASGINITGLTFLNGNAALGGAIEFKKAISNSNINASFINNTASISGGANYFWTTVSNTNITGIFEGNSAPEGGVNGFGGTVYVLFLDGTYTMNSASKGGINYMNAVSGSIITGTYLNNSASQGGLHYIRFASDSSISGLYLHNILKSSIIHFDQSISGIEIKNAVFLNNDYDMDSGFIYSRYAGSTVIDSWFGNSGEDYNIVPKATNVKMDSWLFLNATNDKYNVQFSLMSYDGTTSRAFDNTLLPEFVLQLSPMGGSIDKTTAKMGENITFTPDPVEISALTAQVEDAAHTIAIYNGDFTILQTMINRAPQNSVINLYRSYTFNEFDLITDGIIVNNKNITINGNGYAIDAKGKAAIFRIYDDARICNVAFVNGGNSQSQSVILVDSGNVNIDGCLFRDNTVPEVASVYWKSDYGNISDCIFLSNGPGNSSKGSLILWDGRYGTISDCYFIANSIGGSSVSLIRWVGSRGSISDCIFEYNNLSDGSNDRLIHWSGSYGSVSNTVFTNNSIGNSISGFIRWVGIHGLIDDCIFMDNAAGSYLIYFNDFDYYNLTVSDNFILDNDYVYAIYTNKFFDTKMTNNWFGQNATNYKDTSKVCNVDMDSWIFINATAEPSSLPLLESSQITFKLYAYDSEGIHDYYNPNWPTPNFDLTATLGAIFTNQVTLYEPFRYLAANTGRGIVTASYGDVECSVWINNEKRNPNFSAVIEPQEIDYGENVTITLDYDSFATGSVNIYLYGEEHNMDVKRIDLNRTIQLPTTILPDEYSVGVFYSGDELFNRGSVQLTLKVNPLESDIQVIGHDINGTDSQGVMFTVTLPEYASGNLAISNGTVLNVTKAGKKVNDSLVIEIKNNAYPVGQYNWTFDYLGDDIYSNSTADAVSNIFIIETEITVDAPSEIYVFEKSKVNYTLTPGDAVGEVKFTSNDTSVLQIDSNGNITAISGGSALISVTFEGSDYYAESATSVTVTVNKIPTEIDVSNSRFGMPYLDEVKAYVTLIPAEAGNLTFTSSNSSIAIYENGYVKGLALGKANITVSFEGNDKYAAAENKTLFVTVYEVTARWTYYDIESAERINLNGAKITLSWNDTTLVQVLRYNPHTYLPEGQIAVIQFNESYSIVGPLDSRSCIDLDFKNVTPGVYEVNFTTYGYEGARATINVTKLPSEITVANASVEMGVLESVACGALLTPGEAGNLAYASNDTSVAVVENNEIRAVGAGSALITVSFAGNERYYAAENRTIKVTVGAKDASVSVENRSLNMMFGESESIIASTTPEGLDLIYSSSDESVVLVNSKGIVTAVGGGNAVVSVTIDGKGIYYNNSTSVAVSVGRIPSEITVLNDTVVLDVWDSCPVGVNLTPAGAGMPTFTSSDASVADVIYGMIVGVGEGEATITASFEGNEKYAAAENRTINVVVKLKEDSISVNHDSLDMIIGESDVIVATTTPDFLLVNYTSSNGSVVTVDEYGHVNAVGEGNATITVTINGNGVYYDNSTIVKVSVSRIPTEIIIEKDTLNMKVGDETDPVVSLIPFSAGNLSFKSSNPDVALVNGQGIVYAVGNGTATITVSFSGNKKYAPSENRTIAVTVNLNDASVSVENDTLELNVDESSTIIAVTSPEDLEITFESDNESVATVDAEGNVIAVGEGNAVILLTVGDDVYYAKNTTSVTVIVSKVPTVIDVADETLDLFIDDEADCGALLTPAEAGNLSFKSSNPSVALVNGYGMVSAVGEGSAVVTVSFNGNRKYAAAENRTITVNVGKVPTVINIADDDVYLLAGVSVDSGATLTPDEAGELTYISSNETVVKVVDGKIITGSNGSAVITVSFAGNEKYAPALSRTINVTISKYDSKVSVENDIIELIAGENSTIVAVTTPEGLDVVFKSSDESVAEVDTQGKVTAVGGGTAVITVSVVGNETYADNSTTVTVIVSKIPTKINLTNESFDIKAWDFVPVGATLSPGDAGDLSYDSSNESVAVVRNGEIIGVGEGSAVITVSFEGDDKYAAAEDRTIEVTVTLRDASVSVENDTLDLKVDDMILINATTSHWAISLNYTSSDESVVTVDDDGVVTAVGEGSAVIAVTINGEGVFYNNSTEVAVTVSKIATEITLLNDTVAMKSWEFVPINATLSPPDAGDLTYTSSNESIAVILNGEIIGVGEGSAVITVSFEGDDKYAAAEDRTIEVTVTLRDASVSVENDTLDLKVDDTFLINAVTTPMVIPLNFTSSDESVVRVDEDGVVTAVGEGSAVITVTINGEGVFYNNSTTVTVTVSKIATEITLLNDTLALDVWDSLPVGATLTPAGAGILTFVSSDDSIVDFQFGMIVGVSEGKATITVSFEGNYKYAAAEDRTIEVTVSLKEDSISVNYDSLDLWVDENEVIVATTTPDFLLVNYTSSNESVATVDKYGRVVAVSEGNATITVTVNGNGVYYDNSTVVNVTVNRMPAEIIIENDTLNMNVGDEADPVVSLVPSDAGGLSFKSSNPSVALVNGYGIVYAVGEGSAVVTVSFNGNRKYAAAENRTIAVNVSLNDASISVNNSTLDLSVDDEFALDAATIPEGLNINYTSSNPDVASVDAQGNVKAIGEGTATITATIDGDGIYYDNSTAVTVTVNKIPTEIIIENDTLNVKVLNFTLNGATLIPEEAGYLTFVSSNESVARAIGKILIPTGEGTAVITVSFAGNDKYAAAEDKTITVNVSLNDVIISVDEDTLELMIGNNHTINVTTIPSIARLYNINYVSSDESVVTVDKNGTVTAVGEGTAVITVNVGDNKVFAYNSTNVTVTVSKIPTEITVLNDTLDLKVLDEIDEFANLTPSEAGNLTYHSGNESVAKIMSGAIVGVGEGSAVITISFNGTEIYAAADEKTITVNVSLWQASISVENDTVELFVGENNTIVATTNPWGLDINYTSNNPDVALIDENGTVTAISEGTAVITLSVGDGEIFAYNSTNVTVSVSKIPTEITVFTPSIKLFVGGNGYIRAELSPLEAGQLSYSSNDTSIVRVSSSGRVTAYGAGNATITVSFNGTDKYAPAESQSVIVSVVYRTQIDLENDTLDVNIGDVVPVGATLSPADAGNLTYESTDESVVKVEDGMIKALSEGNAAIIVSFNGADKYAPAENRFIYIRVSKIPTEISVRTPSINVSVGGTGFVLADLIPSEAGELSYSSNDTDVVRLISTSGRFTAYGAGTAVITVSFNGTDKYAAAESKTVVVSVSKIPTEISVRTPSINVSVGGTGFVLADLIPSEAGELSYSSNDTSIVRLISTSGRFTAYDVGTVVITVSFNGTDKYAAAENKTVTVSVSKFASDISIDTSDINVTDINATVIEIHLPQYASGNVTLTYNGGSEVIPINNETVYSILGGLVMPIYNDGIPAGEYNVSATYSGDNRYSASTANGTFTVSKLDYEPKITQNDSTLTVEVPEDATGNITLSVGNETFVVPIENGTAVFDLSDVASGDYNASVSYPGDDTYNGFEIVYPISIEDEFIIDAEDLVKYYHGVERFAVNLTDSKGNPISNAAVTINLNGVNYTRVTDENGSASMAINLNSAEYPVVVTYNGTSVNVTITVLTTVNGTDVVKVFRNGTQYYATFRDSQGNYLKDGTAVNFNINGVMYERKVSGNQGLARLNINLEQGEYIITAINPETGENAANNITVIPRLVENKDIVKYYRNGTQYTVKVIGDDGKPVGAGVTVRFNINGVFYERTTNESGIARLNINLEPGNYVITAEYEGCRVSNNISVLPVLAASDLTKTYGTPDQFVATLVDGEGKALANEKIEFNINGVFYYRATNSTGQAALNINLMPGEYIITSSYNGANIANNVTVKS